MTAVLADAGIQSPPASAARVRDWVLTLLDEHGPLADHELIRLYRVHEQHSGAPHSSDSSIRSRRAELVRDGLAARVPDMAGITPGGHACRVWDITDRKTA